MNDSAFDQTLDALVMGQEQEQPDDLIRFVTAIYRKEQEVQMSMSHRTRIPTVLGLDEPVGLPGKVAGISSSGAERRRSGRFVWLVIAAAALLAMTGIFNWSLPKNDDEGRFLGVPSAIPTVQATPVAAVAPSAEWLMPISPYDCAMTATPVSMAKSTISVAQEFPVRHDYPWELARYYPRMEAWATARQMRSCMNTVGIETFWSDRFMYERFTMPAFDPVGDLEADRILRGQVVSGIYVNQVGVTEEDTVLRYNVGDPEVAGLDPGTYSVINPNWIMEAADGRMIVLVTAMVVSDGDLPLTPPDTSQPGGLAWVLIKNGDEWRIDEYLPVCFSDEDVCASFWAQQPGWSRYVELRTPRPTPDDAACVVSTEFRADYVVSTGRPVNLRPGPGVASGDAVATMEDGESLAYLCRHELTSDPKGDDLYEDEYWLFVRTEDGVEGWVREIDVSALPIATPKQSSQTPTPTVPLEPIGTSPTLTPIVRGGDNRDQLPPIEPVELTPTSMPGS